MEETVAKKWRMMLLAFGLFAVALAFALWGRSGWTTLVISLTGVIFGVVAMVSREKG